MRVELLQGAEADLLEAYVRLEERRAGLGERFYRTLDFALERLRQHPQMAPVYLGDYRPTASAAFRLGCLLNDHVRSRHGRGYSRSATRSQSHCSAPSTSRDCPS